MMMKSSLSPSALPSSSRSANPVSGSPKTEPKLKNASPSRDFVWSPVTSPLKSPVRPGPVESRHALTTRASARAAKPREAMYFRIRMRDESRGEGGGGQGGVAAAVVPLDGGVRARRMADSLRRVHVLQPPRSSRVGRHDRSIGHIDRAHP